jgi:hypothetical protein
MSWLAPFIKKEKQLTQRPNDSASTASLTSIISAATKLHFTEDTYSYTQPTPPMPSRDHFPYPSGVGYTDRARGLARMWTWRKHDSTSSLTSDEPGFQRVGMAPRLAALRAKMLEEGIDYL